MHGSKVPENIRLLQAEQLEEGLTQLSFGLSDGQINHLLDYLALLSRWNKAYNLTAVRDERLHVSRHILDSLSVLPYLKGKTFLDVGSGAGLPGIPLSIAQPDADWTCLDSNGKRTRFMTQCQMDIPLTNVTVAQSRIEKWDTQKVYDGIISRAFSSLDLMVTLCDRILQPGAHIYAMKAHLDDQELAGIPEHYQLVNQVELLVPGSEAQRQLIVFQKTAD